MEIRRPPSLKPGWVRRWRSKDTKKCTWTTPTGFTSIVVVLSIMYVLSRSMPVQRIFSKSSSTAVTMHSSAAFKSNPTIRSGYGPEILALLSERDSLLTSSEQQLKRRLKQLQGNKPQVLYSLVKEYGNKSQATSAFFRYAAFEQLKDGSMFPLSVQRWASLMAHGDSTYARALAQNVTKILQVSRCFIYPV